MVTAGSSRPREPPPQPLTEPYVNLSIHTALIIQSTDPEQCPVSRHFEAARLQNVGSSGSDQAIHERRLDRSSECFRCSTRSQEYFPCARERRVFLWIAFSTWLLQCWLRFLTQSTATRGTSVRRSRRALLRIVIRFRVIRHDHKADTVKMRRHQPAPRMPGKSFLAD